MDVKKRSRVRFILAFLIIASVFLVLASGIASAVKLSWNPISWVAKIIEIAAGVIKAIVNLTAWLLSLSPTSIQEFLAKIVKGIVELFFDAMKAMMTISPTVYCAPGSPGCKPEPIITALVPVIMTIIQPFFVMLTIIMGIYYIFAAMDPKRRAATKMMLLKMLVGMVIVSLSMPIYQFLLNMSVSLTSSVFSQAYSQFAGQESASVAIFGLIITGAILLFPQLIFTLFIVGLYVFIGALLVMAIRYFSVLLFAILFPAALFLYFWDSTKNLGAKMIYQAISWIFVPVIQALMIVISFFALEGMIAGGSTTLTNPNSVQHYISGSGISLTAIAVMLFIVIAGLLGVILAPLIMLQAMKWVGGALAGYGMLKMPQVETKTEFWKAAGVTALGGAMMGGLGKGIPFAATQAAYTIESNERFGSAATWQDILPSRSELGEWRRRRQEERALERGGGGGTSAAGAVARPVPMPKRPSQRRGLVSDFFNTYRTGLTWDKREVGRLIGQIPPSSKATPDKASGESPPLSAAGERASRLDQYSSRTGDSGGAKDSGYLGAVEGPPLISVPLYFISGQWSASLKDRGVAKLWTEGHFGKAAGVSLYETFKVFSPFRPIRHLGRILYTSVPEMIPGNIPFPVPFMGWTLREVAWSGTRKMMGLGFGQMASRASWSSKLAQYESEFNEAKSENNQEGMDKAARDYAKLIGEIYDGAGIRNVRDPDYADRKMNQLCLSNSSMFDRVMTSPVDEMKFEGKDFDDVFTRVQKLGGATAATRKRFEEGLGNDPKNDEKMLLFDFIADRHGGDVNAFKAQGPGNVVDEVQRDANMKYFMEHLAAMRFGVGCNLRPDESTGELKRGKTFDLDAMRDYVEQHSVGGRSLVARDSEGNYRMSRYRLLEDSAKDCARQNEMILHQGREKTNIEIIDTVDDEGVKRQYTPVEGSRYVEALLVYDQGGGLQPLGGGLDENGRRIIDERTRQGLNLYGVGFSDGFYKKPVKEGNVVLHYKGVPVSDLRISDLMPEEIIQIMTLEKRAGKPVDQFTEDDAKLTTAEASERLERNNQRLTKYIDAERKLDAAEERTKELGLTDAERIQRQKRVDEARKEFDDARNSAFTEVRQQQVETYRAGLKEYLHERYGPDETVDGYTGRLREASKHVYFGMPMVDHLRNAGYNDREIDYLRIELYERYAKEGMGGTGDIRIVNNPNNPNPSWVTTDEEGTKLSINIGCPSYRREDHAYTPESPSKFITEVLDGAILPHEHSHDEYRQKRGKGRGQAASEVFRETTHDFFSEAPGRPEDTGFRGVIDDATLNRAREGVAAELGSTPAELMDRTNLSAAVRPNLLHEDELGQLISEGMADLAGRQEIDQLISRGEITGTSAYDESIERTVFATDIGYRIVRKSLLEDSGSQEERDARNQELQAISDRFNADNPGANVDREQVRTELSKGSMRMIKTLTDDERKRFIDPTNFTRDDAALLARMKSLAETEGFITDPAIKGSVTSMIDDYYRLMPEKLQERVMVQNRIFRGIHGALQQPTPPAGGGP